MRLLISSSIAVSLFFIIFEFSLAQVDINKNQKINRDNDKCRSKNTCAMCIKNPNCIWCDTMIDELGLDPPQRCLEYDKDGNASFIKNWCRNGEIKNPKTEVKLTDDRPLSLKTSAGEKLIQIKPQTVNLRLRQGEEYRLKMKYRQAEDYPVDLYFLVDLSSSVNKSKKELADLTDEIETAMKKLTSNLRLGFGSFVDKRARPMIRDEEYQSYIDHYSFKNNLRLTNESDKFSSSVRSESLIKTWDDPEGGFDAMMQVMVCTNQIGWRSNARHLLVHVSESVPHIAGDGKLAGIVEPNDEKCHLNDSGYYTHAEIQDYPSLAQINYQARKNNINIIFATITDYTDVYKAVQSMIQDSTSGSWERDPSAVVELISKHYEHLVKTLEMRTNSTSDIIGVKFYSKCLNEGGELLETNKCDSIRVNLTVEFEVVIKAMKCPGVKKERNYIFEIKPEGINERLIVKVEVICDCECSKSSDQDKNKWRIKKCNKHGDLDCGVCSCDEGYFGESCQCEGDENFAESVASMASCRMNDNSSTCSGRGECMCGKCTCDRNDYGYRYNGTFCECDNFSCGNSTDGKLCGGHGICECGKCHCDFGWIGSNCGCTEDKSACRRPGNNNIGKICNGMGNCLCGKCKCDKKLGRNGKYCEDCPSCPSQRCGEFEDCVECRVHKSGKIYEKNPHCYNCGYDIHTVEEIEENPDKIKPGVHLCYGSDAGGSTFVFTYVYENREGDDPTIYAKRDNDSPIITTYFAATLGVILLTIFLGLVVLLIWKWLTRIHDRKEFEKFERDRVQVHWAQGQNPLYRNAVTTFRNPIFDSELNDEDL